MKDSKNLDHYAVLDSENSQKQYWITFGGHAHVQANIEPLGLGTFGVLRHGRFEPA